MLPLRPFCSAYVASLLVVACTQERPRAGQATTVDTVITFIAEGVGTFPQIADSSRLLHDGSFRSSPSAPPCRVELESAGWPVTHVPLGTNAPGTFTIRLPPTFKLRPSDGSPWVVWGEDSTFARPAHFRLSFRERPQGYPTITIDGTRGQTQIKECIVATKGASIAVALFTIAWLDPRKPDRPYVVAYWEPRPGLPVRVFATGIGRNVQAQFLTALRSAEYSNPR
jgi:hypothetical protein